MLLLMKPHISLPYTDDSAPYSIGISTTLNVIDQKINVFDLMPGLHTVISVTPQLVETSEDFHELDAFSRNCKLPHETYGLQLNKNYTRTICEHECAFFKAVSLCKCTPWLYRNESTTVPICDMFGGHCFDKIMSTREFYKACSKDCLEDCNGIQLSWEKSYQPINIEKICRQGSVLHKFLMQSAKQHFSNDHYERLTAGNKEQFLYLDNIMRKRQMSDHYKTLCKQFVQKYVSIVTVESPTDVIALISREKSANFHEKIGVLGGELGLFTGASIVTILDILTSIYNKIWPKDNKGKEEVENEEKIKNEVEEIVYGMKTITYLQEKKISLLEKMIIQQGTINNQLRKELKFLGKEVKTIKRVSKYKAKRVSRRNAICSC